MPYSEHHQTRARPLGSPSGGGAWLISNGNRSTGLWTPPAVFAEVGNLLLQTFTDDGVPTWEISKKRGERGEWNIIAKGTADSFEAAKAAALFEAEAASWGS